MISVGKSFKMVGRNNSSFNNQVVVLTTILAVTFMISAFQTEINAQTYTKQPYSESVVSGTWTIYAGKRSPFGFTIPSDASNAYLRGTVSSRGGIISQILTTITDNNGVKHFSQQIPGNGRSIDLLLPPGQSYTLTFINDAFLSSEDKDVTANFILSYDRLVPVTGMTDMTNMTDATMGGNMTDAGNMTNASSMMTNST